jgi:pimeloyl-ACP methyl ester carboxylesterase
MIAISMRRRTFAIAIIGWLAVLAPPVTHAKDLRGWGIVLIHGKAGNMQMLSRLASALSAEGAIVVVPRMSWTSSYRSYDQTMDEIAGHVAAVRGKGAARIALLGQSLGANVALGYGARRDGVAAIVAISPGHQPDRFAARTADSLSRAKQLVASGRGGETGTFTDVNQGKEFTIQTTAAAYVSFFDPGGPALMSHNASQLRGAQLLWVVGTGDPNARAVARGGRTMTVEGHHMNAAIVATPQIVDWLKSI